MGLFDAAETATPALVGFYAIMTAHGCRPGELLGLPETAIDFDAGLLQIKRDLDRAGRTPVYGRPKTARGYRTIRLPECSLQVIRDALVWKKEQRLRLGPRYRDSGLLFVGEFGRPLNLNNIRHRDHLPRLERLRLPRSRPYDLRHFYGTHSVGMGNRLPNGWGRHGSQARIVHARPICPRLDCRARACCRLC